MATPPRDPFVEIGLLDAWQPDSCNDRSETVAELRSIAGRNGCDVVIIYGGIDWTGEQGGDRSRSASAGLIRGPIC